MSGDHFFIQRDAGELLPTFQPDPKAPVAAGNVSPNHLSFHVVGGSEGAQRPVHAAPFYINLVNLGKLVDFLLILHCHLLRSLSAYGFQILGSHYRTHARAAEEVAFVVYDAPVKHAVFRRRAYRQHLVVVAVALLQDVRCLVGVLAPQVPGRRQFGRILAQYEVDRFFRFPLEDDGVIAAALQLGPEIAPAGSLAPDAGERGAGPYGETARSGETYAGERPGGEDQKVGGG